MTAHSDNWPKSVTIKSESAVTTRGFTGHTISESAVTLGRNPHLQHERPPSTSSAIFVRPMAPRGEPSTAGAIQKVITNAYQRSGLPHSGSHALRHTLACRLVEHGSSLKEVADLLRHRSLNTTLIYAKLDTPKLSTVPLPWPGSES
ncbi:tyrosine-type recombinase/integrase [Aromatoleum aromaticum]|uniref:tyrosine-type recombinase/integrase n=1 Tax=Aromatoleum aromaticum TaxID=551760 RepID=UPI00240FEA37|nr:tyrosine-type recombinase/integrase [Aromatoleum aromaticum]